MSLEFYDYAKLHEESGIGLDALHGSAPDEILADVPFAEWGKGAGEVFAGPEVRPGVAASLPEPESIGRDSLLMAVTTLVFEGRPGLVEVGLRFIVLAGRCGVFCGKLALTAAERRELRKVAVYCEGLFLPVCTDAVVVFEFLRGGECGAWRIGRRLSLMAYAFNRGPVVREALSSFEAIGELWELKAENKRSAVSAAMNKLRGEILRAGWMRGHKRLESFRFWFEKRPDAKAVYSAAQMGNTNRGRSEVEERMEEAEVEEESLGAVFVAAVEAGGKDEG